MSLQNDSKECLSLCLKTPKSITQLTDNLQKDESRLTLKIIEGKEEISDKKGNDNLVEKRHRSKKPEKGLTKMQDKWKQK